MYSTVWTQFETQSLMFGILRKELYPKFIVRGETGKIKIYKPTADKYNPVLLLTLNIHASTNAAEVGIHKTSEDEFTIVGGTNAKNIMSFLGPQLAARAEGGNAVPSPI